MTGSGKFIKVIFFVLLIIAAGELFYLFFYRPAPTPNVTSTLLPSSQPAGPTSQEQAINQTTLDNLTFIKKSILQSSRLNNQYLGEIIEVTDKGGVDPTYQIEYQYKLKIKSSSGETNTFFYREIETSRVKVLRLDQGKKIPYFFSDLKVGNQIIIEEELNLLKDPSDNLEKLTITAL